MLFGKICFSDRRVRQKKIELSDVLAVKVASNWETLLGRRRGGRGDRFLVFISQLHKA